MTERSLSRDGQVRVVEAILRTRPIRTSAVIDPMACSVREVAEQIVDALTTPASSDASRSVPNSR